MQPDAIVREGEDADADRARDGLLASHPSVPPIYGPKFYVSSTDRDVRVSFGTMQITPDEKGNGVLTPAYRAIISLPYETVIELTNTLNRLCQDLLKEGKIGKVAGPNDAG